MVGTSQPLETDPRGEEATHLDVEHPASATGARGLPATLSRYLVIERLGEGAMGVVLRAYDPRLRREVALKLLRRREDAGAEARMLREAQSMAQLSHPNVVGIYDAETTEYGVMIAMELVVGVPLDRWLEQAPRSISQVLAAFVQAGRGLVAAHAAGLIHRDFKPANVFVGADDDRSGGGRVRVGDFGLAREAARESDDQATPPSTAAVELTATGTVMGTPVYMAPEQHRGQVADERSDQFAFCVSLWQALHGGRPFAGTSPLTLAVAKQRGDLQPPRARVPARVQAAIERGLSTNPDDRWPELAALLERLEPRRRGRGALALVATVAVAGVATAAVVSDSATSPREARCAAARRQLERTWSDERRAAMQADAGTPPRLVSSLDAYAIELGAHYEDTCRVSAPLDDLSFDVTMGCLDARTRRIEATVALMSTSALKQSRSVDKIIDSLTPIDRCAETQWMGTRRMLPDEPQRREQVTEIREDIGRVKRLQQQGRLQEAIALADEVLVRAEDIDFKPILSTALFTRSALAKSERRYDEAARLLRRVLELRLSVGDNEGAIAAAVDLLFVRGVLQDHYEEADGWAALVRGMMGTTDLGPVRRGWVSNHIGASLNARGEPEAALEPLRRAVDQLTAGLGPEHRSVADPLSHLTSALLKLGRAEEALGPARRAVALRAAHFPPGSPPLTAARLRLARAQDEAGAPQDALRTLHRALESLESSEGRRERRAEIRRLIAEIHTRGEDATAAAGDRVRAEGLEASAED